VFVCSFVLFPCDGLWLRGSSPHFFTECEQSALLFPVDIGAV
jgi:hypothetical protein